MSAIFGFVHLDGGPASRIDLEKMSAVLSPYGPDGGGVWTGEHVGLGQRLMCFTPEDRLERQPLIGAGSHHVLVVDGRVDNRPELMEQLGIPLSEANSLPDSAFILKAYEKWGEDCCGRLVGDFAFALWDGRKAQVLIAKSAMSKRPVYYHAGTARFAFASMPKGLFALPGVPRAIDGQSLADYLVWAPRDPGRSLYADIGELRDGHSIVVRREGFKVREFWQPDLRREIRFARDSDYVEAFRDLFDRVVSDYLRSLTPVGVMMSGGLDSSSVAVTAAGLLQKQGKRLATFTEVPRAGFDGKLDDNRYADETPLVEAIGRRWENIDLNFVRTDGSLLLDNIDRFFDAAESPFLAAWNRLWWEAILQRARDQNVRVVLTGAPGNLTISQDGMFIAKLIRSGRWLRAFREARSASTQDGGRPVAEILARGVGQLLPTPVWLRAQRFFFPSGRVSRAAPSWWDYSIIRPEFASLHRVRERAREKGHTLVARVQLPDRAKRYASVRRWGAAHAINPAYESLLGVQRRDPTADARIVEFCLSLPEEQHQLRGVPRSLIRRAMSDRLPGEVLENRRRGLQSADWLEKAVAGRHQMLKDLAHIEESELARASLDLKRMRQLVKQLAADSEQRSANLIYQTILGSSFMAGTFLLWFETGFGRRPIPGRPDVPASSARTNLS